MRNFAYIKEKWDVYSLSRVRPASLSGLAFGTVVIESMFVVHVREKDRSGVPKYRNERGGKIHASFLAQVGHSSFGTISKKGDS